MPTRRFRICRYVLIEEFDHVKAESESEARLLWDSGKVELRLQYETTECGPIAIYEELEGPVVGHDPLPLDSVTKLRAQVATMREALTRIREGSAHTGRWLDGNGTECKEDDPNAEWEPYTADEQRTWLATVVETAETALEATKEGA